MRLTHLFPTFRNLGGVEAVLRGHWEHDSKYGVQSQFIIFSEPPAPPIDRIDFLGWSGNTTLKLARRTFAAAISRQKPEVCVYHGSWLLKHIVDLDLAERRILLFHGAPQNYSEMLRASEVWADGFAAISQPQYESMLQALPAFRHNRTQLLHCPIFPPQTPSPHPSLADRPIVIGYCGRLAGDAKRVDRAPAFIQSLNQNGLDYRIEFLGDGPLESQLKNDFQGDRRIIFHGRKSGDSYWNILRSWDVCVLFSDSEGTPISILETMDQGVLPIMPGIKSGADFYARKLGEEFVYAPYDFATACRTIQSLGVRPDAEIQHLRKRAAEIVAAHRADNYFSQFADFLARVQSLPRHSSASTRTLPWPLNLLKFDSLAILNQFRKRVLRR